MALPLGAQCALQWQPGAPMQGVHGFVTGVALLPNGDLVASGNFQFADRAIANYVARWDGATWHALGTGLDSWTHAVAAMSNGDVVVSGGFAHAGGVPANRIARWNGASWAPLGSGFDSTPGVLLPLPNGDLIAAGNFTTAGGVAVDKIARWNGTTWSAMGSGFGHVSCLALHPNGDVIAGGVATPGNASSFALAAWNGTTWTPVQGLGPHAQVHDIVILPNGSIAFAGSLDFATGWEGVAIAHGTTAQPFPAPAGFGIGTAIEVFANGDLVIAGQLGPTSTSANAVARWNGAAWTLIGNFAPQGIGVLLRLPNDHLIAAGSFDLVTPNVPIARYDGAGWVELGAPPPPVVSALGNLPDGDVVLGGAFTSIGGIPVNNVARWQNGIASPLGSGVDGAVKSLGVAPDGSVIVCGEFQNAGGAPANRIARWDGSSWAAIGTGLPWAADLVAGASGGQVLARSGSQVWYFGGVSWAPVVMTSSFNVTMFAAAPEGDFILGGAFGAARTTRFSHGLSTPTTASGSTPTFALQMKNAPDGKVLACLEAVGGAATIRRLDGNSWTTLGPPFGNPMAMSTLPNGDPVAIASPGLAYRLDAGVWNLLPATQPIVAAGGFRMTSTDAGELLLASSLTIIAVNNIVSAGFAYAETTCPATALVIGAGCSGIGGPMQLAVKSRPWTGGTFRSLATGFPPVSLALHEVGIQPASVPLPLGAPGCQLLITPFVRLLLLPQNGQAAADFAVPRDLSLVGAQLFTQVIGLEFDASGNLLQLTSTNALQLTVGSL